MSQQQAGIKGNVKLTWNTYTNCCLNIDLFVTAQITNQETVKSKGHVQFSLLRCAIDKADFYVLFWLARNLPCY